MWTWRQKEDFFDAWLLFKWRLLRTVSAYHLRLRLLSLRKRFFDQAISVTHTDLLIISEFTSECWTEFLHRFLTCLGFLIIVNYQNHMESFQNPTLFLHSRVLCQRIVHGLKARRGGYIFYGVKQKISTLNFLRRLLHICLFLRPHAKYYDQYNLTDFHLYSLLNNISNEQVIQDQVRGLVEWTGNDKEERSRPVQYTPPALELNGKIYANKEVRTPAAESWTGYFANAIQVTTEKTYSVFNNVSIVWIRLKPQKHGLPAKIAYFM